MSFFTELKERQSTRDSNSEYTLGDTSLDHTIGINDSLVLTPDEEQIAMLAAANFLFGIFRVNVKAFTAIPSGFITSYSKDNKDFGTFINYNPVIVFELIKLCEETKKKQPNYASFYDEIKAILSNEDTSLIQKAALAKDCINRCGIKQISENVNAAREEFSHVNDNNCDENSKVIINIMTNGDSKLAEDIYKVDSVASKFDDAYMTFAIRVIGIVVRRRNIEDLDEREAYRKKLTEEVRRFHEILYLNILPGYRAYKGNDSQILNKNDLVEKLISLLNINQTDIKERLKGLKDISKILNICSTDYSADMAIATLDKLREITDTVTNENVAECVENIIDSAIPRTPDNKEQKSKARNDINDRFLYGK